MGETLKHSKRIPDAEQQSHLTALYDRLSPEDREKHTVQYDAIKIAGNNKPSFTIGEAGVSSFSHGIAKFMFGKESYGGMKKEQVDFANHLTFMVASVFGLDMHRMKKGESFEFDFTKRPATLTMKNSKGEVVVDNQPIEAGAITHAREKLGEERLHIDERISPEKKALVKVATEWNGIVETLETFGENISLKARQDMLQGLDVFDESVDSLVRADTDTINGINKYLRLHFEVEEGLSGAELTAALGKARVNPDGTGYNGSSEQNIAWVRWIRHDLFGYDVPPFNEGQIGAAESGESAFREIVATSSPDEEPVSRGIDVSSDDEGGSTAETVSETEQDSEQAQSEVDVNAVVTEEKSEDEEDVESKEEGDLEEADVEELPPEPENKPEVIKEDAGEELRETPDRFLERGLDVNMGLDELNSLRAKALARVATKVAEKQASLRSQYPNIDFTFTPSSEGKELGDLPYVYLGVSLDGVNTDWSTSRMGLVKQGNRRFAKRFAKQSGIDQRSVEEYLAIDNFERDLDQILEEADSVVKEKAEERLSASLNNLEDPEGHAISNLDIKLDGVSDVLKERLGADADKVVTISSYTDSMRYKRGRWKGNVNVNLTFVDGFEPKELNLSKKVDLEGPENWYIPLEVNDVVDMVVDDVKSVFAVEAKPETQIDEPVVESEVTRVTASSERFDKYKLKPITTGKMPKYMGAEPGSRETSNEKEAITLAEFDRTFSNMQRYSLRGAWKAVESDFLHMEKEADMSTVWVTADPDRLMQFYSFAAMAARSLGDNREAYRRISIAKRIDPSNDQVDSWVNDLDTKYVDVSFKAEAIRANASPFDPNHRSAIKAANDALTERGKFSGLLPKLRDGQYYIVTVGGVERRMYLNE